MLRRTLNLGILAHVDAGKTTLTERLLHAAGVIDEIGSVDDGTTQTDTLELERRRGITIRSAVVSFAIDDVTVNLIDTPGHPDFIAEVERSLNVLDGAVLVLSAVEGVQSQTRVLMRALQRLRVPTLLFVNKIDRAGASEQRVLAAIAARLTPAIVPMGSTRALGTAAAGFAPGDLADAAFRARVAEALADRDEAILTAFVADEASVSPALAREALVRQTRAAALHPVFFGSALTGDGIEPLVAGIAALLPADAGDTEAPLAGAVFKIERGEAGEKVAYARLFAGTLRVRERLQVGDSEEKVTAIHVFERGPAAQRASVAAGEIAKLWGLGGIRVGDRIGSARGPAPAHEFAPPTLETVVVPGDPDDRARLRFALAQLAEQDLLIDLRQNPDGVLSVSLYGEVQKEVLEATLAADYGLDVVFRETMPICVERPAGSGEATEILRARTKTNVTGKSSPTSENPFPATLGLRVEPAPAGSGTELRLDVGVRLVPLYIYKDSDTFAGHMTQYVREALEEGLCGWQVADCTVTLTDCGYRAPGTTAADFRKLTPLVLMDALACAGTVVCEPFVHVSLEVPTASIGSVFPVLAQLGAVPDPPILRDGLATIETLLAATRLQELQRQLPGLTAGEGVLEQGFGGYRPVAGPPPERARTRPDPRNRKEYLLHLARRVGAS